MIFSKIEDEATMEVEEEEPVSGSDEEDSKTLLYNLMVEVKKKKQENLQKKQEIEANEQEINCMSKKVQDLLEKEVKKYQG